MVPGILIIDNLNTKLVPLFKLKCLLFRCPLFRSSLNFRIVCSGQFVKPALSQTVRNLNANRAVVTKTKRGLFERTYPTLLALQDGATIEIKYTQPKLLLKYDNS